MKAALLSDGPNGSRPDDLQRYARGRGWTPIEYTNTEINQLFAHARQWRFDAIVCRSVDALCGSLLPFLRLVEELRTIGIEFVAVDDRIDTTSPSGRLALYTLGAIARADVYEQRTGGVRPDATAVCNAFGHANRVLRRLQRGGDQ